MATPANRTATETAVCKAIASMAHNDTVSFEEVRNYLYEIGETVDMDDLASTTAGEGAGLIGYTDGNSKYAATTVEGALDELASTSAGEGAAIVGYSDAGGNTSATEVESALDEIYTHIVTAQASVTFSLYDLREVDANGDVGNLAAHGGILAADSTPILRGDANESQELNWAATNVDRLMCQTTLPADVDGTANVTVDLWVLTGNTNADAATFTVVTGWDGGTQVTDTATDSSPSGTMHKITATIAAADVPDAPDMVSIMLFPAAHATDDVSLYGVRLNYTRKILTS